MVVFKEEVALGLVGCVGVRVGKRRGPLSGLRLEGYSPLAAVVVLLFWVLSTSTWKIFLLAEAPCCQEQEEGPPDHITLAAFLLRLGSSGNISQPCGCVKSCTQAGYTWGSTSRPPRLRSESMVRNNTVWDTKEHEGKRNEIE